jgi:glyoxylase-like metal-dependent hydrolase (beta-lactamase superfamily II)
MRTLLVLAALLSSATLVSNAQQAPATAQQGQAPQPPAGGRGGGQPVLPIQQVKPGLFLVPGGGSNSIVRVTSDGVILVDTKMPGDANYDGLLAQIKTVTSQPVKVVAVTHHHADHTGNNARFLAAGATVIGHAQLAESLKTYVFDPRPAPPSVTYDTRSYTITLGGAEVQVLHLGRSHTGGDSVIYYPDLKVLLTSDAVTVGAGGPLVDYAGGGSALEWRRVLDDMLALDFDTAIPGAGPVLTRADVVTFRTKFNTVVDRLSEMVRQGVPKDQLLMRLKTDDIGWAPRIPLVDALVEELSKPAGR